MKNVSVKVRHLLSRVAFRAGSFKGHIEDEDSSDFEILGTTRSHDTWAEAATAALKLADKRGYFVVNRSLVERRIREESP
jgi:hypothetical protein